MVEHVSADAIADEARGLVFPARVRITGSRLRDVENRLRAPVALVSGEGGGREAMHASNGERGAAGGNARDLSLLSPGMSAHVEVITGQRSVISYLLSPIARATNEAGRER